MSYIYTMKRIVSAIPYSKMHRQNFLCNELLSYLADTKIPTGRHENIIKSSKDVAQLLIGWFKHIWCTISLDMGFFIISNNIATVTDRPFYVLDFWCGMWHMNFNESCRLVLRPRKVTGNCNWGVMPKVDLYTSNTVNNYTPLECLRI